MTIYSLYVYDRHCACIFYHDWQRTKKARPANEDAILPNVAKRDSTLQRSALTTNSGVVVAAAPEVPSSGLLPTTNISALPFDEEAKLVYGVLLSLRNMVKKLSGRDETFTSYRTSTYKMHHFETLSGYKFVMLTDTKVASESIRLVLRQIYGGPFVEFVVRNPLITMDSKESGIDNDSFRSATDKLVRNLSLYP